VRALIEAFSSLATDKRVPLLIAGYSLWDEEDKLKEKVAREGIDDVHFVGWKDGEELAELYRCARFVVMPTLWYENIPNVILEAMAYGKPVIGSDLGGVSEIIEDGKEGLLFEAGNTEALKSKMERLAADDSLVTDLGAAARDKIREHFTAEKHYGRLIEVFEAVRG
jgi:glycosyltransferase involved in cell wall biosynthesis